MRYLRRALLGVGALGAGAGLWVRQARPPARGPAVPPGRAMEATALGLPNERFVFATPLGAGRLQEEIAESTLRRRAALGLPEGAPLLDRQMLALSGGGENGAFAAGLLRGWSAHGSRPEFHLVTGVSAGALIAPFAFIGASRDDQMARLYTGLTSDAVMRPRGWLSAAIGESLADNAPLLETISRHLDAGMLAEIARGHAAGRLLLVATVNLDAQAAVWWNIGAIAASGHPRALDLARRVLLASAAIPGLFPPAMIDVTLDGAPFQEMHVDGGALAQTFLYPSSFGAQRRERLGRGAPVPAAEAYVIRNARVSDAHEAVGRWTLSIAERALAALIRANGLGDLERIHANAERDGIGFNLAFIGDDFAPMPQARFDAAYMRALFAHAEAKGRAGYPWLRRPPA